MAGKMATYVGSRGGTSQGMYPGLELAGCVGNRTESRSLSILLRIQVEDDSGGDPVSGDAPFRLVGEVTDMLAENPISVLQTHELQGALTVGGAVDSQIDIVRGIENACLGGAGHLA